MQLESTRSIDIEKFVPRPSIDRLCWDMPCHLVPTGKTGNGREGRHLRDGVRRRHAREHYLQRGGYNVEGELEREIEGEDPV